MKKFEVKTTSAGPDLFFQNVEIRSWLGTMHNQAANDLCHKLNGKIGILDAAGKELSDLYLFLRDNLDKFEGILHESLKLKLEHIEELLKEIES